MNKAGCFDQSVFYHWKKGDFLLHEETSTIFGAFSLLIAGPSFFFHFTSCFQVFEECFFTSHVCKITHAMALTFFIPNTAISCFFFVDKLERWCFVFLYIWKMFIGLMDLKRWICIHVYVDIFCSG